MWARVKGRLFSSKSSSAKAEVPPRPITCRSPGFAWNRFAYSISALMRPPPDVATQHWSELYLKTRSRAVAHYCVFGHGNQGINESCAVDIDSEAHRAVCLRLRRCGAVHLPPCSTPDAIYDEDSSDSQLDRYLREQWDYVFGWPRFRPSTIDGDTQPVWVYRIPREAGGFAETKSDAATVHESATSDEAALVEDADIPEGTFAPYDGIEAILKVYDLATCQSMEEYCSLLERWGATYYEDVALCPEARAKDLV